MRMKIEKELTELFRRMLMDDNEERRLEALRKMNQILEENDLDISDIEIVDEKGEQI